jgi:hypothetical protein
VFAQFLPENLLAFAIDPGDYPLECSFGLETTLSVSSLITISIALALRDLSSKDNVNDFEYMAFSQYHIRGWNPNIIE